MVFLLQFYYQIFCEKSKFDLISDVCDLISGEIYVVKCTFDLVLAKIDLISGLTLYPMTLYPGTTVLRHFDFLIFFFNVIIYKVILYVQHLGKTRERSFPPPLLGCPLKCQLVLFGS